MPRIHCWRKQPGKAGLLLLLVMALPLLWQCIKSPLEPVAPKFTTQLAIPLVDKTFYFADIVNKDSKFDTASGQILYNPTKDEIGDRVGIPADVFVMDISELRGNTIQNELGVVPVAAPNISSTSVPASSLLPPSAIGVPLPALLSKVITVDTALEASSDGAFRYVLFKNGTMSLTFQNTLPVAVHMQNNQVQLFNDTLTQNLIGTFMFPDTIAAKSTPVTSNAIPLANVRMYHNLRAKAVITTVAYLNPQSPITINATDGMKMTPTIANQVISSANARLSKDFSDFPVTTIPDSAVKLNDSILVKTADFRSGNMHVRLVNKAPLAVRVLFLIDELIDKRTNSRYHLGDDFGTPGDTITLNQKDSMNVDLPMSRFKYVSRERDFRNGDTTSSKYLHFKLQIKTLVKNTSYSDIATTDYVLASVQPTTSFVLESVYGKIPPQPIAIDQNFDVGIGDIGNRLTLQGLQSQVKVQVGLLSTGLFPTDADFLITAMDDHNQAGNSVRIVKRIQPGVKASIDLSPGDVNSLLNSFLGRAISTLPAKMRVHGTANVNPLSTYLSDTVGSVKQGDSVFVNLSYIIPVAIGIKDGFMWDTTSIAQNNIDTARIHLVKEGKVHFTVTNAFPMALNLVMKLMKNQDTLLTIPQPQAVAISIDADPGNTNPRSGVLNYTYLSLSPADAAKLNDATKVYIGLGMKTGNDNGATARTFYKSDFVRIKSFANMTFDVDFDRLK